MWECKQEFKTNSSRSSHVQLFYLCESNPAFLTLVSWTNVKLNLYKCYRFESWLWIHFACVSPAQNRIWKKRNYLIFAGAAVFELRINYLLSLFRF